MPIDEKALIRFGIAALMPGMRYMQEVIESHIADYVRLLDQVEPAGDAPRRRGRPPKGKTILSVLAAESGVDVRQLQQLEAATAPPQKKRTISQAGRDAVSRAQKARWKKLKAEQSRAAKQAVPKASKKAGVSQRGRAVTDPYWSRFTPDERKEEMARRVAKRKQGALSLTHRKAAAA